MKIAIEIYKLIANILDLYLILFEDNMSKIFSEKYIAGDGNEQIGWQKNVEKSLRAEGILWVISLQQMI